MSVVVVGSIAFDSVRTPFGAAERELGGSAVHAAYAASFFTDVRVVGAVGEDFGEDDYGELDANGIATDEIQRVPGAETFAWHAHYDFDMAVAHTDVLALNVFGSWRPQLGSASRDADILFLAAMDPELQSEVRSQWQGEKWVALDSLGHWIETKRDALVEAIRGVDFVLLNDQEARALTRKPMLLEAAREIRSWGPKAVVLKLGEYGCALLHEDGYFSLPGYPLEEMKDPTGAGDALAGGFLGYLDRVPADRLTADVMRRAVTYGSVMASYCAEEFGARRLARISEYEVLHRAEDFKQMTHFEHVPTSPRPHAADHARGSVLERPHATPTTEGYRPLAGTSGTRPQRAPGRTPTTERFEPVLKPARDEPAPASGRDRGPTAA